MKQIKNDFGWILFWILALIPVLMWLQMSPIGSRFDGFGAAMTSLGQMSGLTGMALFSLNMILSARIKFLENVFGGLNRIYINHHLTGAVVFCLLLFHPLFLAVRYIGVSISAAALLLIPSIDRYNVLFGILSLSVMIILLFLTFFARPAYHIWKLTHKFLTMSFFLAGLHVFFIDSDISRNQNLRVYLFGLITAGFMAMCYRTLFGVFFVRKTKYIVRNLNNINDQVLEIELEPENSRKLNFDPGQFAFVCFNDPNISKESHPFSITSGVNEKKMSFAIKFLGDYTQTLKSLKIGAKAFIEGPYGKFSYKNSDNGNQIWIAGGIGITPFLSMAKSLKNDYLNVHLIYCVKNSREAYFMNSLHAAAMNNKNLKISEHYSEAQGRITAGTIRELAGDLYDREIFLCGPVAMMRGLREQFIKLGVRKSNIHSEEFEL